MAELATATEIKGHFGLFVGAGCSVSSGVATTAEIARDATQLLFNAYNSRQPVSEAEAADWLRSKNVPQDTSTAYADSLRLLRPTPRLRRIFLEKYFTGKTPSPAHWALAKLVESGIFRLLYTTNFDDLLERSVGVINKLRVVSYDQTVIDDELDAGLAPVLYRMHGDFLFETIADAEREFRHLRDSQTAKLRIPLTEGGLIVAGYSGRDTRIMSTLAEGANCHIPLGLYWLHRSGDELAPQVKDLLTSVPDSYLCLIDSFDDFVAKIYSKASTVRRSYDVRNSWASTDLFIAREDGVGKLLTAIRAGLRQMDHQMLVITGLPGVGKTTTARHVAEDVRNGFESIAFISVKDRHLDLAGFLDECRLQLPIGDASGASVDESVESLVKFLRTSRTLIVVDNLDSPIGGLAEVLGRLPPPSKVLITSRDARPIRSVVSSIMEIRHTGLTSAEMRDLLDGWARLNPTVRSKIDQADGRDIDYTLEATNGWPEALILLLRRIASSLLHFQDVEALLAKGDLYSTLLGDAFTSLERGRRLALVCAAAFPSGCSVEGLVAVSSRNRTAVERWVAGLVEASWLTELSPGQFVWPHPIVGSYVRKQALTSRANAERADKARRHLHEYAALHGGQPTADWSNFNRLDREFENLRSLMEQHFSARNYRALTSLYRSLFSYIVERGYWLYTEVWCERMVQLSPPRSYLADWLIWWSWIKFYLREDFAGSAELAERAIKLDPRWHRQAFEAHRRALVATAAAHDYATARVHYDQAHAIQAKVWRRDSDEAIDLLNAWGNARLGQGEFERDADVISGSLMIFDKVRKISASRRDPNTREVGVAMLGEARGLYLLGQLSDALLLARQALEHAVRISWLRGVADCSLLVKTVADAVGDSALADSAGRMHLTMRSRLQAGGGK